MSLPNFFYSERIMKYSFGPKHPLKPERLRRTIELLERFGVVTIDPGSGDVNDVLRVHSQDYVNAVEEIGLAEAKAEVEGRRIEDARFGSRTADLSDQEKAWRFSFGLGGGDNPPFPDMHAISLDYVSSVVQAAKSVANGADLAFGIGGGLHHAQRQKASGFCIYNDPAIACSVLRDRFDRVAYVDIDLHHGDGVEMIFWNEPNVLTCSIHESGKSLYPGTGFEFDIDSTGTVLNVPLQSGTTGDVWLAAFVQIIIPALHNFRPEAIVLQCGCDPHFNDPLGHLNCRVQDWLGAVAAVRDLEIPTVVVGGGGYALSNVPRMWTAACLTMGRIEFVDEITSDLAQQYGTPTFFDHDFNRVGEGRTEAERVVKWLKDNHPLLAS
jgi:acetoin utilization protein AcuC